MSRARSLASHVSVTHAAGRGTRVAAVGFELLKTFFVVGNANKKGSIELIFKQYLDENDPYLDFRFQLAILGQKIASTLGGV